MPDCAAHLVGSLLETLLVVRRGCKVLMSIAWGVATQLGLPDPSQRYVLEPGFDQDPVEQEEQDDYLDEYDEYDHDPEHEVCDRVGGHTEATVLLLFAAVGRDAQRELVVSSIEEKEGDSWTKEW